MDQVTPLALSYDAVAAAQQVAATAATRAAAQDRDDGFSAEDVADLARLGLLAAPVPSHAGGAGLGEEPGARRLAAVLRLVGYGSLALGRLYEGHVNALQLVARYGSPGQRERLFVDARDGHLFGVWNTEPPGGDLALENSADGMRLTGVKTLASGAGYVTRALETSRGPGGDGTIMLVVPLEPGTRADLSAWRAHGVHASATGTLDFTGIAVAAENVLGGPDDYFRQPDSSGGAWRFAAVQLGGIESVFDAWRGHLAATGRGGDPHQLACLGEGAIAVEGARLWVERAADTVSRDGLPPERVVAFVNLARLAVERAGLDVLQLAQPSVGLQGFLRPHPLERLSRDLATYLRQLGPGAHRGRRRDHPRWRHGRGPLGRCVGMSATGGSNAAPAGKGWLDTAQRYGRVSRGFHWLMAALFAWQFAGALLYVATGDNAVTRLVGGSHFTLGFTLFVLVLLRGAWGLRTWAGARCIRGVWVAPRWLATSSSTR